MNAALAAAADAKYTRVAMLLHWATVALVAALYAIGWHMVELPKGPARGEAFALHKSIGMTVFLLTVLRLAWRLYRPPPPLPARLARWQRLLATAVHHLFYVLLLLQPVMGYLSSSFSPYPSSYFGLPLPDWGEHNPKLNEFFTELHVAGSVAMLIVIALHVLGALSHLFKAGDHLVRRMLPW
ncbi:MAG: cytochrome b [Gammaproteobacteria bacterium]